VTDKKLVSDLESMLSVIDHDSLDWARSLVAPLVTKDRKRAKALYRKYISMMDTEPKLPPPSVRCPSCYTRKRAPGKTECKVCGRVPRKRQSLKKGSTDAMIRDLLKRTRNRYEEIMAGIAKEMKQVLKTGVPVTTAIQQCPHRSRVAVPGSGKVAKGEGAFIMMETAGVDKRTPARELYGRMMKIRRRMLSRTQPKEIEIQGIWSDGEVTSKVLAGGTCSTGVAMLYMQSQRPDVKTAKLWLVRFFNDNMLVREWDEINQKYNLELD
jgi:hypothetical protein